MATTGLNLIVQSALLVLIANMVFCGIPGPSKSVQRRSSEETNQWEVMVCEGKGELYGFKEDVMKEINACEPTCRLFCHIKILKLINDKGLPDEGIYSKWVDETFAEKYKDLSKKFFGDCFQKYGNKIDLNDKTCKVADQFADCTWGLVPHLKCG